MMLCKCVCGYGNCNGEDGDEFDKAIQKLQKEVEAARNLLAFIHRDGGHHREKFELDSYKIAENIVVVYRSTLERIAGGEHPDEAPDLAEEGLEKFQ